MWVKYLTQNKILKDTHWALADAILKRNSIVVDPRKLVEFNESQLFLTADSNVKLQRRCSDVDNNIPPITVGNWDDLVHLDFKLFKCSLERLNNACTNVLLYRFLTNRQPLKILHLSLDEPGTGSFMLLSSLPEKLQINGNVVIEINDRTDSIKNTAQARKLIDFPCFKSNPNVLTIEYFKTILDYNRGWSLTISESNTEPFYFWDV